MSSHVNRREFLKRLGVCAGGVAASQLLTRHTEASSGSWVPPPSVLTTPNILIIMVDQMRFPCWLSPSQMSLLNTYLPNIFGQIRNNSYVFNQYFAAATACTPSRATLLTGLYAPQTAMYITEQDSCAPSLVSWFPTWATALQKLESIYAGNVWWFGKWHLSDVDVSVNSSTPLIQYGFNTGLYPGSGGPSPDGYANEGVNGGPNTLGTEYVGTNFASDEMITTDFVNWMNGTGSSTPWCATLSLINPHDISGAPGWLPPSTFPWNPNEHVYYPQPIFPPALGAPPFLPTTPIYASAMPAGWNWENQTDPNGSNYVGGGTIKPCLQLNYIESSNQSYGAVTSSTGWAQLLNQYYWLQSYVDQQVGAALSALTKRGLDKNTIVIFLSDHGEYAGSHGLHGKAYGVYDESIHVPLYIRFPGQPGPVNMPQMCSAVDFFRLICDLATGGGTTSTQFLSQYPDQANRQRIWDFLYSGIPETRTLPGNIPYILHTTDERSFDETGPAVGNLSHIVCLRGKAPNSQAAKLAIYSEWARGTTYPDSTPPAYEFYDYSSTNNNMKELGNNYNGLTGTANLSLQSMYETELGSWGPPATGIIGSELTAPLVGAGNNGQPLSQALATAQQNYFTYLAGGCPTPV